MDNRGCAHDHPVWVPERRCTGCGHRLGDGSRPPRIPRPSRELSPLLWPFELTARLEARLRRWLREL